MRLNDLYAPKGINRKIKRRGRGRGSGHGKTSCRGHKGQKARSGKKLRPGFEGGQMPLARRVPKRGFTNPFKAECQVVNVEKLNKFKKDTNISVQMLRDENLIKSVDRPVKILGGGKISKPLTIQAQRVSKQAREKIEKAGGKIELVKHVVSHKA